MIEVLNYIWLGVLAVFQGPELFSILGYGIPASPAMVLGGLLTGIAVGATPGLAGPMAMAISLPILISIFGFTPDALLPVFGFLIGIMKGATVGGAVPAILFNMPGTPDALMTTLDGHPMAQNGQPRRALKIAQLSSVTGDTFSDLVLFICAPFLAVFVEAYLDQPEKTALLILSISFIAAVMGGSVGRGLLSVGLGLLAAFVGTGQSLTPRLTAGVEGLSNGFPLVAAILGVLILGEIFKSFEDTIRNAVRKAKAAAPPPVGLIDDLEKGDIRRIAPHVARSAVIGTIIGALPGVGSTLAATLSYTVGRHRHEKTHGNEEPRFGYGAPEGIAATEAANSAVSGANLIPVLSLGIPGNAAAVFLILAADSIGGFNPGPAVFNFTSPDINPELVTAFGIFTLMSIGNLLNWTIGGRFMRSMGVLARVPSPILLPVVLLLTLTAIYVQETSLFALWVIFAFGVLGYLFRRSDIPVLPFVIAFILAGPLEQTAHEAFAASGGDPWFLFRSATSVIFMTAAIASVVLLGRGRQAGG
ncbi:tripartite tricarboxylate transporter permease [Roseobacter sp. GAI101]|uniref:tripartite tricarboxylate transporter permease n=1 Tax=Roseobacter sp. (strain GAI101) TaxID=391589 RepID=UPI0001871430|nr:tripartite tricarboxylate transporter permease [Roseobacter sp. GAI101]EEB82647.1 trap-t family transporter, fused small and large inner membrane subunit [Roseobacter sp. GAI101]